MGTSHGLNSLRNEAILSQRSSISCRALTRSSITTALFPRRGVLGMPGKDYSLFGVSDKFMSMIACPKSAVYARQSAWSKYPSFQI